MATKKIKSQLTALDSKKDNTNEEIKNEAYEIYLQRTNKGIHGSAEQDWNNAIDNLQNNKISNIFRINEMEYHNDNCI